MADVVFGRDIFTAALAIFALTAEHRHAVVELDSDVLCQRHEKAIDGLL